ncbi:hypothetical protein O9H85_27335 [Paenibacillus filicis]|uniref:IstB-like ATP-binding protein domain-containing protein n=1 Tax=Paenibacillus gyeongsangnamensis TaxID=3388067 RepID=A0ABT4QGN7_9BACL|nr:hypothetical protein [Paenibacillus filicis]MCZ8516049.1 hypothetical protein [Paenibacillus filicis]
MTVPGESTYKKVIALYKKVSLLIIDEWLLVSLTASESRDSYKNQY